jgi:surface carbohydrate biosynthesis protein
MNSVPSNRDNLQLRIGIVVDHPTRDLPGAVLLAQELARRGAHAIIVPLYEQGVDVPRLGLHAILMNHARDVNFSLIKQYSEKGVAVYVLDTEGGVLADRSSNSPPRMADYVCSSGYGRLLSGYMFWGRRLHEAFLGRGALPPECLHLTGCPRFDFAAPKWRKMLDRKNHGYLLVNANFPSVNPRFARTLNQECENMIRAGWDREYVQHFLSDLIGVFEAYLSNIRAIAKARPNWQFLVRPHPFESDAPYRRAVEGLPNVTVDGRGSVLEAIHNAAAILHLNCGTAIEAVLLDKLPIQMDFLNTPRTRAHSSLSANVSRKVTSLDELLRVVDALGSETAAFDFAGLIHREIEDFFYLNDGQAGTRVADVLCSLKPAGAPWISLLDAARGSRPQATPGQRLKGVLSVAMGSAVTERLRTLLQPSRRGKKIEIRVVRQLLAAIAAQAGYAPETVVVSRARCLATGMPLASLSVISGQAPVDLRQGCPLSEAVGVPAHGSNPPLPHELQSKPKSPGRLSRGFQNSLRSPIVRG